ncbi:MAG: hypothetical protein AB3N15_08195 [Paracoccaceae bacterium]
MLNVFAKSFMTATRMDTPMIRDAPEPTVKPPKRWLPKGHWWLQRPSKVDLNDL